MEEATFLTKFADEVVIVHRRDELRASKIMQDRARAQPQDPLGARLRGRRGARRRHASTGVRIRNLETGEPATSQADGLFVAIGHDPNTGAVHRAARHGRERLPDQQPGSTATNVAGVFAAGDVADHVYRQAVTAAGSGCAAALDAERWLTNAREAAAVKPRVAV